MCSHFTSDADNTHYDEQNHRFNYDEPMGVEACVQAVCDLALRFGENRKGKEEQMVCDFCLYHMLFILWLCNCYLLFTFIVPFLIIAI